MDSVDDSYLLTRDGDLLSTKHYMTQNKGEGSVEVSEVKGHADQAMVDDGSVRHEDFFYNDGADTTADLGRLRQQDGVINVRRAVIRARRHWHAFMLELHKFMVGICRIQVNCVVYGGTAPDAMMWEIMVAFSSFALRLCGL